MFVWANSCEWISHSVRMCVYICVSVCMKPLWCVCVDKLIDFFLSLGVLGN